MAVGWLALSLSLSLSPSLSSPIAFVVRIAKTFCGTSEIFVERRKKKVFYIFFFFVED